MQGVTSLSPASKSNVIIISPHSNHPSHTHHTHTDWSIGSERDSTLLDVFPRTLISFNSSQSAAIASGMLYLDDQPFASLSEVIALAEGREVDPVDDQFYFEPGRLFYHSLEFCNFIHRCTSVTVGPSVLISECRVYTTKLLLAHAQKSSFFFLRS